MNPNNSHKKWPKTRNPTTYRSYYRRLLLPLHNRSGRVLAIMLYQTLGIPKLSQDWEISKSRGWTHFHHLLFIGKT